MLPGQRQVALDTADELAASLTADVVEPMADWIESFYPMKQHVLTRMQRLATFHRPRLHARTT
jgi:hypothetical protein